MEDGGNPIATVGKVKDLLTKSYLKYQEHRMKKLIEYMASDSDDKQATAEARFRELDDTPAGKKILVNPSYS